mmetsp:Transcript_23250/g.38767  ORF Transcript_23250/g.38767 Transcript_23250/m.38767 type:complete len:259 (+) Transcript_23250:1088-1864(+)
MGLEHVDLHARWVDHWPPCDRTRTRRGLDLRGRVVRTTHGRAIFHHCFLLSSIEHHWTQVHQSRGRFHGVGGFERSAGHDPRPAGGAQLPRPPGGRNLSVVLLRRWNRRPHADYQRPHGEPAARCPRSAGGGLGREDAGDEPDQEATAAAHGPRAGRHGGGVRLHYAGPRRGAGLLLAALWRQHGLPVPRLRAHVTRSGDGGWWWRWRSSRRRSVQWASQSRASVYEQEGIEQCGRRRRQRRFEQKIFVACTSGYKCK